MDRCYDSAYRMSFYITLWLLDDRYPLFTHYPHLHIEFFRAKLQLENIPLEIFCIVMVFLVFFFFIRVIIYRLSYTTLPVPLMLKSRQKT